MTKDGLQRGIRLLLAAGCLVLFSTSANAGSFTRGCAARDMQLLMMIEERENANAISSQKLNDVMFTLMHARIVCFEGRVVDALALYDGIAQTISTDAVLTGRIPKGSQPMR
jgi:hypothetical protein